MVSTVGQLLLDQSGEGRKESERERRGGVRTQDGVVVGGVSDKMALGLDTSPDDKSPIF